MFKLICKNLWARRRRNGWLMSELVVVTIICWVLFDPVVVITHDRMLPMNYDSGRLVRLYVAMLNPQSADFDKAACDSSHLVTHYFQLLQMVRDYPGVECATPLFRNSYPSSQGSSWFPLHAENDTTFKLSIQTLSFLPHSDYFRTFGFRGTEGFTAGQLDEADYDPGDILLTDDALQLLFHSSYHHRLRCWALGRSDKDTLYLPVRGVVSRFKVVNCQRPYPVCFEPMGRLDYRSVAGDSYLLLRLKEGMTCERFLHDFRPWMVKNLRCGNLYVRTADPFTRVVEERELKATNTYRLNLWMLCFFLVNLCLGVAGTFWLQTRTRREEVGVLLSFGGTPRYILRLLLGEGTLLALLSVGTGSLLYLQYALKEGLSNGLTNLTMPHAGYYWVEHFGPHFLIVTLLVFLLIWAVVLAGIYIPARQISRIPLTEALRDE